MPGTRTARGTYAGSTELSRERDTPATPAKSTEGPRPGKRGRPKGSKNKPKGLVPSEVTEEWLPVLQKQLSPESFQYVEGVLKKGKPIETKRELDVMIAMLARNLIAAISQETMGLAEYGFRKDITERLKILNSMLTLRHQIEKASDDGNKPGESVLLKLVGDRKLLDGRRLGVLVGDATGSVAGDADGVGRETVRVGAVPSPVPERPLLSTGGEQE
jgi:hypothetical protein